MAVVEDEAQNIVDQKSIDTKTPAETLPEVVQYFVEYQKANSCTFDALGIASFGPVDLNKNSETFVLEYCLMSLTYTLL